MKHRVSIGVLLALLIAIAIAVVLPTIGFGEVPQQISYQGRLTDTGGDPMVGDHEMSFSIYSVSIGGMALWSEVQRVTVDAGIYNIQIGQDPTGNPFPADLYNGQRWLGVAVGIDAEMTPRQKFTSTPFAMRTAETDPTVPSSLKDGVSWGELYDIPSGFADSVDNVGMTTSIDYGRSGVASNLYEGSQILSSRYINDDRAETIQATTTANLLSVIQDGTGRAIDAKSDGVIAIRSESFGVNGAGMRDILLLVRAVVFSDKEPVKVYGVHQSTLQALVFTVKQRMMGAT